MSSGGGRAVLAALSANLGIAVIKFVAFAVTGAQLDAGRGRALGGRLRQPGTAAGRRPRRATARRPRAPVRLRPGAVRLRLPRRADAVLGRRAVRALRGRGQDPAPAPVWTIRWSRSPCCWSPSRSRASRCGPRWASRAGTRATDSWLGFIRHAKVPELPAVLLEDVAALTGLVLALLGVGLAELTGEPVWDGIGTCAHRALLSPSRSSSSSRRRACCSASRPAAAGACDRVGTGRRRGRAGDPPAHDAPGPGGVAGRSEDRDAAACPSCARWPGRSTPPRTRVRRGRPVRPGDLLEPDLDRDARMT